MALPLPERNIEIKARIGSDSEFQRRVQIARNLTSTEGKTIVQKDVFFQSKIGRLKLRYLNEGKAELVQYDRPDVTGPRLSKFNKIEVDQPEVLEQILNLSNGCLGVLRKIRLFFLHNNTRIHFDKVDNLGNFMEFEVKLTLGQTEEDGRKVVNELMTLFEIHDDKLMGCSYFDELRRCISLDQD